MADNVSSSVLFHFTTSMVKLKGILRDGIFPHYCPEYTLDPADREAAAKQRPPMRAAPMVCFCDLPISLIRNHLKEYGNFGIGLEKSWGRRNGLSPVIYTHANAQTRRPISRLTENAAKNNDRSAAKDLDLLDAYTKPFAGPAWRNNDVQRRVRFYDEREWRYVPAARVGEQLFLDRKDYSNEPKRNELHKRFQKQNAMRTAPNDIQYLILPFEKDENNIIELYDYVMKLFAQRYTRKEAKLVTSAIMTVDRIHKDV